MTATAAVRVRGTSDATELAAVLAAVLGAASRAAPADETTAYDRWRQGRQEAVRRSLNSR